MKGPPTHWTTLKKLCYLKAARGSGPSWIWQLVTGTAPLTLLDAVAHPIHSLTQYGLCIQDGTPTPSAPVDILCNNGAFKVRRQSGLPLGYQRVEYIEGNGTAYIDTGVLLSNTDVFEITFQSLKVLASPVMGAISGGTSFTSTNNLSVTYTTNADLSAYSVYCDGAAGNVNYSWNGGNRSDGLKHTIKYNGLNIAPMLDGVAMTQVTSNTLVENTPTVTTWLFGRNNTSTGTLAQSGVRIFDFNIQSKGHFIPARRNSDNVLGMYDLVSGQFLTNAGTGSFTAGEVVDDPVEIYTDGTDEVLTVYGQNLVDLNAVTNGYYYSQSGVYTALEVARLTDYIPVKGGKKYTVYVKAEQAGTSANVRCNLFDSAKAWKSQPTFPVSSGTANVGIVTPAEDGYLRVSANYAGTGAKADWSVLQIVLGEYTVSTMPPYEPFVTPQAINDIHMLLGVNDAYRDEAELIGGLLTHKIGIYVFTGEEAFVKGTSFYADISLGALQSSHSCVCSHFVGKSTNGYTADSNTIQVGYSVGSTTYWNRVYITANRSDYATAADFQAWLAAQYAAGTPVIVLYPLADATTEQTTPHALHTSAGTNVVDVTAEVSPVQLSVEYAKGAG